MFIHYYTNAMIPSVFDPKSLLPGAHQLGGSHMRSDDSVDIYQGVADKSVSEKTCLLLET